VHHISDDKDEVISGVNGKRVTFTDVLRVREFRTLWLADAQSSVGDQLARVALSVLVFERTSSALLTAATYSLTFLPAFIGGTLLSPIADRVPRRRVMVACDVVRGVLFAGMALPRMPLLLICLMLCVAMLAEAPFSAAQSALTPCILTEHDYYVVGTGLRSITYQVAQLAGFAGGGVTIAAIGARGGLALDALSFGISGIMIMMGVRARPAAQGSAAEDSRQSFTTGFRLVFTNPKLRTLVMLSWLAGVYVVPEGVAAPYAGKVSQGATGVGLLLASIPFGVAVGTYLFVRWIPAQRRTHWMAPLGLLSGVPLAFCLLTPPLVVSLVLWFLSGLFFCYQVQVVTEFVRAVPDKYRGQATGIAASGLLAVQGVGVLLGGWVASGLGVGWAVGGAGLAGMLLAALLGVLWERARLVGPKFPDDAPDSRTAEAVQPVAEGPEPARRGVRRRLVNAGNQINAGNQQQHRHRA
jgi:MFS family permease